MTVKYQGAPGVNPPKPVNKAVIEGQGSIPYESAKSVKTPNTEMGSCTTGKKKGMGAALRGSRYKSC
jgi:hypothetical protein